MRRFTAKTVFLRVGEGLALGDLADQALALGGEADDGGRGAGAFLVGDDLGGAALHHRHAGVRGPEVDADDLTHVDLVCFKPAPRLERMSNAGVSVSLPGRRRTRRRRPPLATLTSAGRSSRSL